MRKGFTFLPSLALAALIAIPALAGGKPDADTVIARVNGTEITLGHMITARASLPQQYQDLPKDVLFDGILNQLIQQTALAESHGPGMSKRIKLTLENERRQLLAGDEMERIMASAVSEADIQAAYDTKYAGADGGPEYNASHILVETEDEATAIVEKLRNGADFAETAKAESTGPSGPGGGALGWFSPGQMVPEFETAVMALSKGEVSDPVKTQFGWHVIILNDKRQKTAPKLNDVRNDIATELRRAAVDAQIKSLTDAADIERPDIKDLDTAILGDMSILDN